MALYPVVGTTGGYGSVIVFISPRYQLNFLLFYLVHQYYTVKDVVTEDFRDRITSEEVVFKGGEGEGPLIEYSQPFALTYSIFRIYIYKYMWCNSAPQINICRSLPIYIYMSCEISQPTNTSEWQRWK